MLKRFIRLLTLLAVALGGGYGVFYYEARHSEVSQLKEQNQRLLEQKKMLEQFLARLKAERRVAEILVTEQPRQGGQIQSTTLMFIEYGRDGHRLPPKFFTIKGDRAHIDALVIKFDPEFVQQADPLRGQSICLFYRIFGEYQAPTDAFPIDPQGSIPAVYRPDPSAPQQVRDFEASLWEEFWKLTDDPVLRAQRGVRIAQGEGVWRDFHPDQIYTLTLDANGGLNISNRPIDGVYKDYRDALRRQHAGA